MAAFCIVSASHSGKHPFDIAVPLDDIDDLENVALIAKEDHIAFEDEAPQIRAEFGARYPQRTRERGELDTLPSQRLYKSPADSLIAAFPRDIGKNLLQVIAGTVEIDKTALSITFLGQLRCGRVKSALYVLV